MANDFKNFIGGFAGEGAKIMAGKRKYQADRDLRRAEIFDQTQMYLTQIKAQTALQRETDSINRTTELEDYQTRADIDLNKAKEIEGYKSGLEAEADAMGAEEEILEAIKIGQSVGLDPETAFKAYKAEGGLKAFRESVLDKGRYGDPMTPEGMPGRMTDSQIKRSEESFGLDKGFNDTVITPVQDELKRENKATMKVSSVYPGISLEVDGVENRMANANRIGEKLYQRVRKQDTNTPQTEIRDQAVEAGHDLLKVISPAKGTVQADKSSSSLVANGELNPQFKGQFDENERIEAAVRLGDRIQSGQLSAKDFSRDQYLAIAKLYNHSKGGAKDKAPKSEAEEAYGSASVPAGAIQALKDDPSLAADFEAKYGVSAKRYLGE